MLQLHFQSPLLIILHDQLLIVVGEINLLQAWISTRALVTYNWFQVEAEQRLYEFPDHDAFVEMLQKGQKDEGARVQRIKAIDDQILKNEIGHTAVSVHLLEEQVRLNTARVEAIKNQAEKFELSIQFLEPSSFEGLAVEATTWRKFLENQAGPSSQKDQSTLL